DLTDEPALADPCFAEHRDQLPGPRERLVQPMQQTRELRLTTEHRIEVGHGRASGPGRGRSASQDLLAELGSLRLRLAVYAETKRVDAALVLQEGGVSPAVAHVQAHEGAVGRLLERIHRQQAQGRLDRSSGLFQLCLMTEQPGERLEREFV